MDELEDHLKRLVAGQKKQLFLRADKEVPYGTVVQVMGEIKAAGVDKLGIVAEEPKQDKNK
jgi:biopolymer transport protein TolR